MVQKIPPAPVGALPGSSYWNDWYEKIRNLINSGTISQLWSSIDFTASNITDIVTRNHNNLQSFQGGTAGEYYHLTSAQHAIVSVAASGVYTPTPTNTTNVSSSTAYQCQYLRVGTVVTVSGKVDVTPTAVAATVLELSLPIASNIGAAEDLGGTAASDGNFAGRGAAMRGSVANNTAEMSWVAAGASAHAMFFSFTYRII